MSNHVIRKGSGNVYKDLGFSNAEEMQAKAALVSQIVSIIKQKKLTQEKASAVLGIPQPKISLLTRGHFSGFSLGKLITLLNRLNQDVEIIVRDNPSSRVNHVGHINVIHM